MLADQTERLAGPLVKIWMPLALLLIASHPVRALTPDANSYAGVYQWEPSGFVYLQQWIEFTGKPQHVAFDESGVVRTLYPAGSDRFTAGYSAAVPQPVESKIAFQRSVSGTIVSFTWQRGNNPVRTASRVEIESRNEVAFANGEVHLAGTLIVPGKPGKYPAIVLVHGSGAEDREYSLPLAHYLIRHGVAILSYDKRGTGKSTGDWNTASFDDLAGDAASAISYLRRRSDIDRARIGLMGVSQAGWIMPLAALRSGNVAFMISISGPGIPAAETTIDQARNEMIANGTPAQAVDTIVALMTLEYRYARTGEGWNDYAALRGKVAARMGSPPASFPGTQGDPYWYFIWWIYFYVPGPTLKKLRTPTLAVFGELDNNVMAGKNRAAWDAALKAGGNPDYTLRIIPKADHLILEAKTGSN